MEQSRDFGRGFECGLLCATDCASSHEQRSQHVAIIFEPNHTHVKINFALFFVFSVTENGAYDGGESLHR